MKRTFLTLTTHFFILLGLFTLIINTTYAQVSYSNVDQTNFEQNHLPDCDDNCCIVDTTINTRSSNQILNCSKLNVKPNNANGTWVNLSTYNNKVWLLHNHWSDGYLRFYFKKPNTSLKKHILVLNGEHSNVGIGVSHPKSKLHIKAEGDPNFVEGHIENGKQHGIQIWGNKQTMVMGVNTSKEVAYIKSTVLWEHSSTLALNPNGGSVTIGTLDAKGYRLAVKGSIKAKEIKVTLDNWADFVFDDNYNLRSLSDLEKYIKTNKHLPNIPSAEEVKGKDLGLGEMNKRLLQKVEELTLYTIQQQKEIDKLKQLVKELTNNK